MNKLDLLNQEQDAITSAFIRRIEKLLLQKHHVIKKTVVTCLFCERRSQLKGWKIVLFGGMSSAHSIGCPHCGEWNRFHGNSSLRPVQKRILGKTVDYRLIFKEVWYWAGGNMPMRRTHPE